MKESVESFKILKFFIILIEEIIFSFIVKYIFEIQFYFGWKMWLSSVFINILISAIIFAYGYWIEDIIKVIKALIECVYKTIFIPFIILVPLSSFFFIGYPSCFYSLWSIIFILIPIFPIYIAGSIQIKYSDNLKKIFKSRIYIFLLSCVFIIISLLYFFLFKEIICSAATSLAIIIIIPSIEYYLTNSEGLFKAMSDKEYMPIEKNENKKNEDKNNENELKINEKKIN